MMQKNAGRFALVLLAVLALSAAFVMAGCGKAQSDGTGSPAKQQTLDDKVNAIVDSMTTTEKVGQMVMIGVQGTAVTDDSLYMLHQYHMGGVILFDRNMESADQTKKLIADLQAKADQKVPLFIGVDEEGGQGERGAARSRARRSRPARRRRSSRSSVSTSTSRRSPMSAITRARLAPTPSRRQGSSRRPHRATSRST